MLDLDKIDFETVDVDVDEDGNGWFIEDNEDDMREAMSDIDADLMDEDIRWVVSSQRYKPKKWDDSDDKKIWWVYRDYLFGTVRWWV